MTDHVKTILRNQDGKFVAFWQRSTGRPWVAVVEPDMPTRRQLFETSEAGKEAARKARAEFLDQEE